MGKVRGKGAVLFAIAMVTLASAALAITIKSTDAAQSWHGSWAVRAGDNLTYEISGLRDGAPVTGTAYANFTVVNVTENGSSVGGHHYTDLGDWTGSGINAALSNPSMGSCVGQQVILTEFGDKHVTRCIDLRADGPENTTTFIVTYAGVDSKVIYRVNVSGPSFFLSLDLVGSTVEEMNKLGRRAAANLVLETYRPQERFVENYQGGGISRVGVWDLPAGTLFNYSLEGDGSTFLVFDEANIYIMEHGNYLEYDPELSVLEPPGAWSKMLDGGLYMVAFYNVGNAADAREEFVLTYPT